MMLYSCEFKPVKVEAKGDENYQEHQEQFAQQMMEESQKKVPICAYCKYNVNHCFKTIKERETHEQTCENRYQYEANYEKTSRVYNRNKAWIEQARYNKKTKNQNALDTGEIVNVPQSTIMPHLTYKYVMNEPFVQGTSAQIQNSHDQFKFKRARDLFNPNNDPVVVEKTEDEMREEQVKLWDDVTLAMDQDASKLIIKQDGTELFGLEVVQRTSFKL